MEDAWSVGFTLKMIFHQDVWLDQFMFFSLQTVKGSTIFSSTKKSAVRAVLYV